MALKKKSYKIKSGDTLSQIAKRMGMSLKTLKQANPKIENVNKIRVGQTITIPSLANLKGSKDPYKGMTAKQMADMDVKNKDMARQRRVSRDVGTRGMDTAKSKPKKKAMPLPKSKPKTEIAKKKRVSDRLAAFGKKADEKTKTTKKMAMPKSKPKTKAKPKKELTEVQKKSRAFFSKLGKELMRKGPKSRTS